MNDRYIILNNKKKYILEGIFKNKNTSLFTINKIKINNKYNVNLMPNDINKTNIIINIKNIQLSNEVNIIKKKKILYINKKKYIITTIYKLKNYIWSNILIELIQNEEYCVTNYFYYFISTYPTKFYNKQNKSLTPIYMSKNNLLIFDSLLHVGGNSPKYKKSLKYLYNNNTITIKNLKNLKKIYNIYYKINKNTKYKTNIKTFLYSEHSGIINCNLENNNISNIIINNTNNVLYKNDTELFFPNFYKDFKNNKFIFHTHPPTPYPGSRINIDNIVYEFPSISDLHHFAYHYNNGITCGEFVFAPEGIYLIRPRFNNKTFFKKINILKKDDNIILKKIIQIQAEVMKKYNLYNYKYSKHKELYYSKICQDTTYINRLNIILKDINLFIDYFPKVKNIKKKWVYDSIIIYI
jgi:hypothetical protein